MPESFDEAFPEGMDECVRTLGSEPSVDDPEKLCGWLQENGFEALSQASSEVTDILHELTVEFVSVVDEPAQNSEWILAKSADADPDEFDPNEEPLSRGEFVLKQADEDDGDADEDDEPERKVWAAVLVPGEADKQGDLIPEPEIEQAAHGYLKHYRKVDEDHDLLDGSGVPIESYIIRDGPETFDLPGGGEKEYPPGTWIMGVELTEDAWKRVEQGELTGFSIYGGAASLDPSKLLTEEQASALKRFRTAKEALPDAEADDLLDELEQALSLLSDPSDEDDVEEGLNVLGEGVDRLREAVDSDEEGDDENVENEDDDEGDDEDEQEKNEPAEPGAESGSGSDTDMGDEPNDDDGDEQNDKLDRILSKVEETGDTLDDVQKSVSSVQERVEELEEWKKSVTGAAEETPEDDDTPEEGDELTTEEVEDIASDVAEDAAEEGAEKALTKFLGLDEDELPDDPDERNEVVRKGVRSIGGHAETEDSESINISNSGITEEV